MPTIYSHISRGLLALLLFAGIALASEPVTLEVFAGSASAPVLRELIPRFEAATGIKVRLSTGGSGAMLSKMILSGRGDIYIPGSSDFMERAKKSGIVDPDTEKPLAYLIPAICVPKDNPKKITSLKDLAGKGLKVALGRPESVCVGLYAVEILEGASLLEEVKKNVVTYAESCEKTAQLLAFGTVDAVMGWDVFAAWRGDEIVSIPLPPEQLRRVGYIPAAVAVSSKRRAEALRLIDFLSGEEGRAAFSEGGYMVELPSGLGGAAQVPVGGSYELSGGWR